MSLRFGIVTQRRAAQAGSLDGTLRRRAGGKSPHEGRLRRPRRQTLAWLRSGPIVCQLTNRESEGAWRIRSAASEMR